MVINGHFKRVANLFETLTVSHDVCDESYYNDKNMNVVFTGNEQKKHNIENAIISFTPMFNSVTLRDLL